MRPRKRVDYAEACGEDDDDEDFAVSSKKPKKPRSSANPAQNSKPKHEELSAKNTKVVKERQAVTDRLLERDMELAMSLSKNSPRSRHGSQVKLQSAPSYTDSSSNNSSEFDIAGNRTTDPDKIISIEKLESKIPEVTKQSNMTGEDKDCSESDNSDDNSDQEIRGDVSAGNKLQEEKVSSDDDDDYDDGKSSSDSDDEYQAKGQAKKSAKPVTAKSRKTVPAKQTAETSKQLKKSRCTPAGSSKVSPKMSSVLKSSSNHTNVKSSDIQRSCGSPSSGVLRLGLSRNARVKSLHQHAAI